ncbi:peptide ABC transporter substrate-binding protein [Streptococcus panodentis]|uniref:Peptide ABC transporter ATP-binding protein n=1 Tax=Streptococcus panodentis TaxID=1581472 RepID=A0ABS5AVT6_9STRE|nr:MULTISPECIES: peptide ABC transporter substrate-binding protein [Streptococcus]KXT85279.1 Oligopeptide ABC transporter, periplasmic oligopeptide-binding protein OppA [Streptococcus sp. DD11]MBP2620679.1 peptide ABC transporter ATP-binding protein [Streptococcus panodentis]
MKKRKLFLAAGVTLLSFGILAACSSNSQSSSKIYSYVFTADPTTLDYIQSAKVSTHELTTNGVDGLLENDKYGNLAPSLAEDWTVSKDGLVYTYKLRKDAKWYTADGEEYADVKAQDFVTGIKHAADAKSDALLLIQNSIKGLNDYVNGSNKDFSAVGVKALDDYTVEYTLNQPETYWNSKTTAGVLMPVNEDFLKKEGDGFGQANKPDSILYNGPFIMKSITSKSSVEFEKNPNYWDKDKVKIDGLKFAYYDGSDQDSLARVFGDGGYSQARLYPATSSYSAIEKKYKDNIFMTEAGPGVGLISVNIDRQAYEHTSKTSDSQKEAAKKALLNKDFRQAMVFAFNRETFSAQVNGEAAAKPAIRNLFVPPTFVQANGKEFGTLVEEALTGYGDEWKGSKLSDGQDGFYSTEKAKAEFAKAKEALQAEGVEFPIHLDVPVAQNSTNHVNRMQSLKQSLENTLGKDNISIDLQMMSEDEALGVTYNAESASQQDWDLNGMVGWDPDYQDPSTYLDILLPGSDSQTKTFLGFEGADNAAAKAVGLDEYDKLVEEAGKETQDISKRYEKYAAAQAWLTDSALIIPTMTSKGAAPFISRVVPYTTSYAQTGTKDSAYKKYTEIGDETITTKDYEKAHKKWLKEKEESNKKAQADLEKHVK